MRRLVLGTMAGLLLTGLSAYAQDYGRYRDDGRYSDRNDRAYRDRDGLIDRVQADLRNAQSGVYSRGEAKRLDKAREELFEFERKLNAGRFDRHELNDSIAAIQKVVDHGGLDERARSVLWNDLERLREFRANYEGRGYYGYRR